MYKAIIILLLPYFVLQAQDTTKTKEVIIEDEAPLDDTDIKYLDNENFTQKEILRSNPIQLSDIITSARGVSVRRYGGINSLQTVSLRGLPSGQTLILLDGMRLNGAQNGTVDISRIPMNFVESINISKGGISSRYGSNAMAGVIDVTTKKEYQEGYSFSANYDLFENGIYNISLSENLVSVPFNLNINLTDANGRYSFQRDGKSLTRINSSNNTVDLGFNTSITGEDYFIKPIFLVKDSKRGVPGPVLDDNQTGGDASLDELDMTGIINGTFLVGDNSKFKSGLFLNRNSLDYKDPDAIQFGAEGIDNAFNSSNLQFYTDYSYSKSDYSFSTLLDINYNNLNGDMLDPSVEREVDRLNLAGAVSLEKLIETDAVSYQLFTAVRYDYFSDTKNNISPSLSFLVNPKESDLSAKVSISRNFRAPSFNELYYLNFGNTDLMPEIANSINTLFMYKADRFSISLSGFYNYTENFIVSVPKSLITWQTQNLEAVRTIGGELGFDIVLTKEIVLKINYTRQNPVNLGSENGENSTILVYTPQEMISSSINYSRGDFNINLNYDNNSFAFATLDNNSSLTVPGFDLLNLHASYSLEIFSNELTLFADILNIIDDQYDIVFNYPMPGRNLRMGVSYDI